MYAFLLLPFLATSTTSPPFQSYYSESVCLSVTDSPAGINIVCSQSTVYTGTHVSPLVYRSVCWLWQFLFLEHSPLTPKVQCTSI